MASTHESAESIQSARTRRRVSRVNYAEDTALDDTLQNMEISTEQPTDDPALSVLPTKTPKVSKITNMIGKKDSALPNKRDMDAMIDKFPMNWQPKIPPANPMLAMLDFRGATVKDSKLHLSDGTVFSPEGNFFFQQACCFF